MNIFGDIAGNYKTFQALLKKMPGDDNLLLGDFIDRGPNSKSIIEWLMANGSAILGNHEHMLIDAFLYSKDPTRKPYYQPKLWLESNGGIETIKSYKPDFDPAKDKLHEVIPESHIEYLQKLPLYLETDKLFLSHAPLWPRTTPLEASKLGSGFFQNMRTQKEDFSLIWNIGSPKPYLDKIQIFGHKGFHEPRYYSPSFMAGSRKFPTDKIFAIGIDTSHGNVLTGIHFPSMQIFQQSYID